MFRYLHNRLGHYLLLVAVWAALTLPNLGAASLWDIDEGNNSWPTIKTESKFEVFKARQLGPRAIPQANNPMQLTGKDKKAF